MHAVLRHCGRICTLNSRPITLARDQSPINYRTFRASESEWCQQAIESKSMSLRLSGVEVLRVRSLFSDSGS